MKYLLDTNICIYASKGTFPALEKKFHALVRGVAGISVVTYGELMFGVEKSQRRQTSLAAIERIISFLPVMPLDENVALEYAIIRAHLEKKGTPISGNDMWIAAHAIAENMTVVTNNEREFKRIPKLKVENWTK